MSIAGERDEIVIIDTGADSRRMEWLARGVTIRLGGASHIAEYSMSGADVKRAAVPRTLSLGLALGRAVREAREAHADPVAAPRRDAQGRRRRDAGGSAAHPLLGPGAGPSRPRGAGGARGSRRRPADRT